MNSFVCVLDKKLKGNIAVEARLIGNVERNGNLKGRIINTARLVGNIGLDRSLKGRIANEARLVGTIGQHKNLKGRIVIQTDRTGYDNYVGSYEVIPKIEDQLLPTKEKYLQNDIKIKSIPYYEVSNNNGGITVIIGGEDYEYTSEE